MIRNLTFFDNAEEIEKLTGLSHNELWEHGFNLDDMDWGFAIDGEDWFVKREYHWAQNLRDKMKDKDGDCWFLTDLEKDLWKDIKDDPDYDLEYEMVRNEEVDFPGWLDRILDMMADYCVGYSVAVYNGKTYITQHHA